MSDYAFPLHALGTTSTGLTKRELFAAMAMQGLLANTEFMDGAKGVEGMDPHEVCARIAVKQADALLAAVGVQHG